MCHHNAIFTVHQCALGDVVNCKDIQLCVSVGKMYIEIEIDI